VERPYLRITGQNRRLQIWHASCSSGAVSKLRAPSRSVEVFIVDARGVAAHALGSHRPDAEATHVLCRHADESTTAFQQRVLERTERIRACRRIRGLWYVVGGEMLNDGSSRASGNGGSAPGKTPVLPLLDALVGMLESGASLTVVGPGTHQGAVFAWLDALVPQHRSRVNVRAQLYPHTGAAIPALATGQLRRGSPRTSPPSVRIRALDPEGALADSV